MEEKLRREIILCLKEIFWLVIMLDWILRKEDLFYSKQTLDQEKNIFLKSRHTKMQ